MEQDLIKAAKRHDVSAQTELYRMYKRYWFSICLRYQTDKHWAEDCLQNAMVRLFSNLNKFDPNKGDFKSWSAKIVANENLSFLRDHKNMSAYEEGMDERIETNVPMGSDDVLSSESLMKLIRKLPSGYRTVFNLYVLEGYTHEEIAQIENISVGTSKSQLSKARRLLKQQLEVLI